MVVSVRMQTFPALLGLLCNLTGTVSPDDLARTYVFTHALNARCDILGVGSVEPDGARWQVQSAFEVRPQFRRRGFARALYAAEEALYRRWGVREVHLLATDDGPVVWMRFGFRFRDPELVQRSFREWNGRRQSDDAPSDLRQLPEALGSNGVDMFRVLE
jgi:GNAT superfamily N-acetyltransferase